MVHSLTIRDARKRRAWDLGNPGNAAARRQLTALLLSKAAEAIDNGGDILDAGCGTGWWLQVLSEAGVPGDRLYGIDASPVRARAAHARVPTASISTGDVRGLPFEAERFDLVTFVLLLSSLRPAGAVHQALDEAWRVLRPAGQLVCYEFRIRKPCGDSTRLVPTREIDARFGPPLSRTRATVHPPLARRLGRLTSPVYDRLATVPIATSHVVTVHRKGTGSS